MNKYILEELFVKEFRKIRDSLDPNVAVNHIGKIPLPIMDFTMDFVDKHDGFEEAFIACKFNPVALYALCLSRIDGKSLEKRIKFINKNFIKQEAN